MKDRENLALTLLTVSAAILATLLVLLHTATPTALADTPVRGGDYIMITGAYDAETDLLYVIDVAAQRLNVYALRAMDNNLQLKDQFNLAAAFSANR